MSITGVHYSTYNLLIAIILLCIVVEAVVNIVKDAKEKKDQNTFPIIRLVLTIIALTILLYTSYKYSKNEY